MAEKKMILIVEDDEDMVEALKDKLEYEGYNVAVCDNGLDSIEIARKIKPSLILLDVILPKLNGFETCNDLKSDPETSSIPVVMLTAKGQDTDMLKGSQAGADDYIVKPFDYERLMERVKEYCK